MKTQQLELFEKYYNGEMPAEEKVQFEEQLEADDELKAAYQEYLGIYEALGDKDMMDLRAKLKEIREENVSKRKPRDFLSQGNNWMWLAALLVIIISITVITSLLVTQIGNTKPLIVTGYDVEKPHFGELDRELMKYAQRNSDFSLKEPDETVITRTRSPLRFEWTITGVDSLIIDLLDWNGKVIYTSGQPVSSPHVINKKLPYGIVIFRFRTDLYAYHAGIHFFK